MKKSGVSGGKSAPILMAAVSSRALFDLEEENRVFEENGPAAYRRFQQKRLDKPASAGVAFPLVKKLLALNSEDSQRVEVMVLSRNDPVTGLRVFRSVAEHSLPINCGAFTRGASPFKYLRSLGAHLFLSAHSDDVKNAIADGVAAAQVYDKPAEREIDGAELRIAFDGDAVLFGDESERVHQTRGLKAFVEQEKEMAKDALSPGPFKPFLDALHQLQNSLPKDFPMKIRTALITARGAPAHERPIRTLMKWGVEVDEAFFLHGRPKEEIVAQFNPDFFFDDQTKYCAPAAAKSPTGHVNYGVVNE